MSSMNSNLNSREVSRECEDLTFDQIRYLTAISAFLGVEKKHSVRIKVIRSTLLLTGRNDSSINLAIQEIKSIPGHREEVNLPLETLQAIQKANARVFISHLNKLNVKAGWLVDMEKKSLFVYSANIEMVEKAKKVLCNCIVEFEAATPDIVRFLKRVGIKETLTKTYGIGIDFSNDRGDLKMVFSGPDNSKDMARCDISRSQLMKNWKQRWVNLEKGHLQEIHATKNSEVVQRLRAADVNAGWHADLNQGKLFTYGSVCDAAKAIEIVCGMSGNVNQDPWVRRTRPMNMPACQVQHQQPPFRPPPVGKLAEEPKYNESISDLEQEKISYLNAIKLQQQVQEKFKVKIKIETRFSSVKVSGNSADQVLDAKAMVNNHLKAVVIQLCSDKPQHFMQSLKNVPGAEIKAALRLAQVKAGWDIRNGSLIICCDSRPIFSKAEDAIYSLVVEGLYPDSGCLGKEQLNILSQPTWGDFVTQLRTSHRSFAVKLEEDNSSRIMFAVFERDFMVVKNSLNKFFGTSRTNESTVPMEAHDAQILRANLDDIKLILQPKSGKSVEIIELTDTQCTLASDSKESLPYATEQLNTSVRNMKEFLVTFRRKAQIDWLNSSEGSERIEEISSRTKTVITCKSRSQVTDDATSATVNVANRMKVVVDDISQIASKGSTSGIFSSEGIICKSIKERFPDFKEVVGINNLLLDNEPSVWVYHSRLPDRSRDHSHYEHLRSEVRGAMKQFSENQVHRVAFPAVGTGKLGYSPKHVANTIMDAIHNFLQMNQQSSIQEVYLVAFSSSDQVHQEFQKKLMELKTVNSGQYSDTKCLMVAMEIRGLGQTHVEAAQSRIMKAMQKLLSTEHWIDSPVKSYITMLTSEQKRKIQAEASARDIEVTFKPDNIIINGEKEDVRFLHGYIDKILHSYIDSGARLPIDWNMTAMVDGYAEVVLDAIQNRDEYRKVSDAFEKTLRRGHLIMEIKRVQNAGAYKMYMSLRNIVSKKLKREERSVETWPLWHGTDHDTVSKITKGKFDRGLSGKNATAYGAGCYFARSARYSSKFSPPNASREKVIILARVITGEYCLGDSLYRAAPYKPGSDEQYDSVVDKIPEPDRYVVFEDRAALAEYIIKFHLMEVAA